jgi:cobalt-zinc-cadmium efflux system outer membrane protein
MKPNYLENYEQLAQGMTQNYQRGNIEIIAFADFYESYRDSITKMNQTLLRCALTFEEFNYAIGQDEIKL